MKKLLAVLCLLPALAKADSWELVNQAGGKIVLTTTPCSDKPNQNLVFSTTPSGNTIFGCWFGAENFVMIVWSDGAVSTFPGNVFTYKRK